LSKPSIDWKAHIQVIIYTEMIWRFLGESSIIYQRNVGIN